MVIKKYINKIKILKLLFLFLRYLITLINIVIGAFILSVLIDKIFPLPIFVFHIYWVIIGVAIVFFFFNLLLRAYETLRQPYKCLQEELYKISLLKHFDDVINAYLIEKILYSNQPLNFSKELSSTFVEEVAKVIKKIDINKITGFNKIIKVLPLNIVLLLIILILYFLPPQVIKPSIHKILFTRRPEILGIFITPKNIKIPYGESCIIKIIVEKGYELYKPELFIKTEFSEKFIKTHLIDAGSYTTGKIYKYEIPSVERKIFYKVKFRGVNSKVYVIQPIVLPEISDIRIIVIPPSYTKLNPYNLQSFAEGKFLYGSEIKFSATMNKEVKEVYLNIYNNKIKLALEKNKNISGNFKIIKDTELFFEIFDTEGLSNILKYQLKVVYDRYPKIEILSPEKEIIVDRTAQIPIVYSAKDDIGILKVKFIYKNIKKNYEKSYVIKEYTENNQEILDEYLFDLTKLDLDFGDIVSYHLVVYDNDEISNYKTDITDEYKIEIFSYERQHELLQREIKNFIEEVTNTLSREIELKEKLCDITTSQIEAITDLIRQHQFLFKNFNNLNDILNSILDKMPLDPYTSIDTYMEFKNLHSQIGSLKDINEKLIDSLKQNDITSSSNFQDQIINTLERAAMLTDKIIKRQNMQNLSNIIQETTDISKDIFDYLNQLSDISKEDKTKLLNLLKEIEDKLNKIANMLKNIPNELPEDFINRRDIQDIDFSSPMELLNQIYSAISKGNISSAIKMAESLMKQLNSLAKTLMDASSDVLSLQTSYLKEELDRIMKELDELIESQQKIYDETKTVDEYRIKETLKLQEKLLDEILKIINKILIKIKEVTNLPQFIKFVNSKSYEFNCEVVSNNLNKIITEIKNKKLIQTSILLKEAISYWEKNVELVKTINQQEYNELIQYTIEIRNELQKLNEIFNLPPKIEYPLKIIEKTTQLYNSQNNLIKNTNNFLQNLKSIGKESFIISNSDIALIMQAKTEMLNSKENLSKLSFPEALQNQSNATNLLLQLKNNFSEKRTMLEQIFQSMGQPMSSKMQIKSSSTGRYGVMFGRVILPSAKEYIPPKHLREDIIKSLSEKYPEEFKKIIEDYYKKMLK
ncbi:MAG: hypothetical protein N2505_02225 [Endomicrobia bacterium]|nr:hypothetical protein [Endomicrobiia bacterium]